MALNVDSKVASELSAAVKAKVSTLADDKQSTFANEFQAKARRKGAMKLLAWFFPVQLFLLGQVRLGVMFWVTMVVGCGFEDANFGFALPSLLKIAGGIWWVVEIVIVSRRVREYNEKVAFTILHDMQRLNGDSVGANQIQGENAANRNGKMMKCGTCRAEIAATAETCPKCGAANKKKPARGGCLQYGAAVVLFIIVIAWLVRDGMMGARHAESGAPVQVTKAGTATAAEAIPSDIKVGDTITTPKFEVTSIP